MSGDDVSLNYDLTKTGKDANKYSISASLTGDMSYCYKIAGSNSMSYTIAKKDVSELAISFPTTFNYTYTGSAIQPTMTVQHTIGGTATTLTKDTQYIVSYDRNTNAGTATVTITGKGNYVGTTTKNFTITPASIASATITFDTEYDYTGKAIKAVPTVKIGTKELVQGADFTVAYSNNINVGTATVKPTVTITGKGNYDSTTTQTGNFVINPITIYVTGITVANKPYDGTTVATVNNSAAKLFGVMSADKTSTGEVDSDKLALAFDATSGTVFPSANVGRYDLTITGVTLAGTSAGNYELNTDSGLTCVAYIQPKEVTISGVVVANGGKTYDGTTAITFDTTGAVITGLADGETLKVTAATGYYNSKDAATSVGVTITGYTLGDDTGLASNYAVKMAGSQTSTTAKISQATITATLSYKSFTSTYGESLNIVYTQSSEVSGESIALKLEYYDATGNTLLTEVPKDAGNYKVKLVVDPANSGTVKTSNYTVKMQALDTDGVTMVDYSTADVIINKAPITVSVDDKTIVYGSAIPAAGDYTLRFTGFIPADKAAFEGDDEDAFAALGYTAPTISTAYDPDDASNKNVGDYDIELSGGAFKNYTITLEDGTLTVIAKKVTVTINSLTVTYGDTITLTSDAASQVVLTGDDIGVTLTRGDDTNVNVDVYTITGNWTNKNYEVTFKTGICTIKKATLTVTGVSKTVIYGNAPVAVSNVDPADAEDVHVTYSGWQYGEDASVLGGSVSLGYTYKQYDNIRNTAGEVIKYYVIPSGLTATNYEIVYANGPLTVTAREVTVNVSDASCEIMKLPASRELAAQGIAYEIVAPDPTVNKGVVNNDNLQITFNILESGKAPDGIVVATWGALGTYNFTGESANKNYNVKFEYAGGAASTAGVYSIVKGELIITANTLTITYGSSARYTLPSGASWADYIDTYVTATGLPAGKTLKDLIADGTIALSDFGVAPATSSVYASFASAGKAYNVGDDIYDANGQIDYIVIPKGITSQYYNFEYNPGKLIVLPKTISVTLDSKSSVYGADELELTASATGLVKYDSTTQTVAEYLGITDLVRDDASNTNAGSYAITASGWTNKNYRVTFVNGTYTITPYEIDEVNWDGGDTYTYNGIEQAPVAYFTVDGVDYRSDATTGALIEVRNAGTNAGTYTVKASLLSGNYAFKSGISTTKTYTIKAKQLTVELYKDATDIGVDSKVITDNSSTNPIKYTYDGNMYAPVVRLTITVDGVKQVVDVPYTISGARSEANTSGVYTATLTVLSNNYSVATGDSKLYFTISKSTPNGGWYTDGSQTTTIDTYVWTYTYNGAVQHPVYIDELGSLYSYEIHKISDGSEELVTAPVGVGSYKIVATPINNSLQIASGKNEVRFTIAAQEVEVVWSASTFEYNGKVQVPTAYFVTAEGLQIDLEVKGDKGTDANKTGETYSVYVELGNENYRFNVGGELVGRLDYEYTITAKDITVKWTSKYTNEDGTYKWSVVYDNADEGASVTALPEMENLVEEIGLRMVVKYKSNPNGTSKEVDLMHDAGIYTLSIELTESSTNYNIVDGEQVFTIEQRPINITANNQPVKTGGAIPALTVGWANTDFAAGESEATIAGLDASVWLATNYDSTSSYIADTDYDPITVKNPTLEDIAGLNGYYIVLTDSISRLENLDKALHNYDWTFIPGKIIITAVSGDVRIAASKVYNGDDQKPTAQYKVGDEWKQLKVDVYDDEDYSNLVEDAKIIDVGTYYLLLSKRDDSAIELEGRETEGKFAGSVKKTFEITKRKVEVNISDTTAVYGELMQVNYESVLAGLFDIDAVNAQTVKGHDLGIKLSSNVKFEAGYAIPNTDEAGKVVGYDVVGSWSEDETLRNNYDVQFKGSNGDKGVLLINNAQILFRDTTEQYNQIIDLNGSMRMSLDQKTGNVYANFEFKGNSAAQVSFYYGGMYDLNKNDPNKFKPENDEGLQNNIPVAAPEFSRDGTGDKAYFVNFKIVIPHHDPYYGQWTAQVLQNTIYIRILFLKEYNITYGESVPDGTTLADTLWNDGYISKSETGIADKFQGYIDAGKVTAKVVADTDGLLNVGKYNIVFEGLDKVADVKYEVTYKANLNSSNDATNLNKFVVNKRDIQIEWDNTTFEYDGEAHIPTPSIEGWKVVNSVKHGNETVYTFEDEVSGITLNLTVKTNGGDFTSVGSENIVMAEIADGNYLLDSTNATRAVSITGGSTPIKPDDPVDPGKPDDPVQPVVQQSGFPNWAIGVISAVAALALIAVIVLVLKRKKSAGDSDGFYDDVTPDDLM